MTLDLTDRWTLIASLPKGAVCAEIGVAWGALSDHIVKVADPSLLVLVDSWQHLSEEEYGDDPSNSPQHVHDGYYREVSKRFADKPVKVIREFSLPASLWFDNEYFDWVYLDANHLQVRKDIDAWWPKVKSGGYLMGHDYTMAGNFITVKHEVDAWIAENGFALHVAGLDSSDIYERNYPSWCVQKP